jgi:hypothetical protein
MKTNSRQAGGLDRRPDALISSERRQFRRIETIQRAQAKAPSEDDKEDHSSKKRQIAVITSNARNDHISAQPPSPLSR